MGGSCMPVHPSPTIISDNGTQFDTKVIKVFYMSLGIKHNFLALYHPLTSGLVEATKKIILDILKKRLLSEDLN